MFSSETTTAPRSASKPENTAKRSKTVRSSFDNNEYDHSTVARNVWWRSIDPRRPPASNRNRSSSSDAISVGLIATTRAAASSIARGMPSSLRQISSTAAEFASPERELGASRPSAVLEQPDRVGLQPEATAAR